MATLCANIIKTEEKSFVQENFLRLCLFTVARVFFAILNVAKRERNGSSDFYDQPSNVPLNGNKFPSILERPHLPFLCVRERSNFSATIKISILMKLLKFKPMTCKAVQRRNKDDYARAN